MLFRCLEPARAQPWRRADALASRKGAEPTAPVPDARLLPGGEFKVFRGRLTVADRDILRRSPASLVRLFATADRGVGLANAFVERGRRAAEDYATAREFNAGDRERVGGLGRKAFFTPSTGTVFVLEDGTTMFYVQANTYSPDKTRVTTGLRDALVELAKQAEARI